MLLNENDPRLEGVLEKFFFDKLTSLIGRKACKEIINQLLNLKSHTRMGKFSVDKVRIKYECSIPKNELL